MNETVALIVAGGSGRRFGDPLPKQYLSLAGYPVLRRTVMAFLDHPRIDQVQVVRRADDDALYRAAIGDLKILPALDGGAERQDSVRLGLAGLASRHPARVLIHDAARPMVSSDLIGRTLDALDEHDGAIAALPVTDTLKRALKPGSNGSAIQETVERSGLWRAQTPQSFRFPRILAAHQAAIGLSLSDDAAVAERAGLDVVLVMGSEENVKITTPDDLAALERRLGVDRAEIRVGNGFDVHQFGPGDAIMLCGVKLAHDHGVIAHSDGDVGLHALTDAVLGAVGAGDIGTHFPPSDERWRGAASWQFLKEAAKLVGERGGRILHVDLTIICERPKVGPHRAAMAARIAEILGIEATRVSVKATTTEGLGFTGRREGIAAQATATVRMER